MSIKNRSKNSFWSFEAWYCYDEIVVKFRFSNGKGINYWLYTVITNNKNPTSKPPTSKNHFRQLLMECNTKRNRKNGSLDHRTTFHFNDPINFQSYSLTISNSNISRQPTFHMVYILFVILQMTFAPFSQHRNPYLLSNTTQRRGLTRMAEKMRKKFKDWKHSSSEENKRISWILSIFQIIDSLKIKDQKKLLIHWLLREIYVLIWRTLHRN